MDEFHSSSPLLNTDTSSGVPVSPLMTDLFGNIVLAWQLMRQELWGRLFNAVLNNTDKKTQYKVLYYVFHGCEDRRNGKSRDDQATTIYPLGVHSQ